MKNLWVVRSRKKLFTGLAFALGGFLTFYTLLTLLVLEPTVLWKQWLWSHTPITSSFAPVASKYRLLTLPLLSLAVSILFRILAKRDRLPLCKAPLPPARQSPWSALWTGENFLISLLLFFWQMDRLNTAKGIPGFSRLVPALLLAAVFIYLVYATHKYLHAGKGERS